MLESKGFETSSKVERDRLDLSSKQKQVATAELTLQILQQFDLPKSEKRLRNNVTNAQNKLTRTIAEGENKVSRAKAKQAAAQKAYQKAVDKLEEISTLLPLTTIHSEVEGYVLYPNERNRRIEQGQPVMRGQTLMRIPKMDDMKVDISVPEAFISALAVGQEAIVTIDSIQDASFSGKVSHIALLPTRSNNWLSNSVQKYKVTIDVEDTELPADIKPQISASAEILLDHLQDTLYVPIQSVHTIQGDQIVYKRTGKNAYEAQTVEIGKMNTNFMQILSGITAQDEVLITDPAADAIPALEEPDSQTPSSTDSTH